MSIVSAALLIFLVIDPLGNIPLFACSLKGIDVARQPAVIVRELLLALAILVVSLFFGYRILTLLGISEISLGIAGGIILLMIAVRMVFSAPEKIFENSGGDTPLLVPLAVPYVAGPSAIATVMLIAAREPARRPEWLLAVFLAWFCAGVIMFFSTRLRDYFGVKTLEALGRLMGLVLTAVAVEMLTTGLRAVFS